MLTRLGGTRDISMSIFFSKLVSLQSEILQFFNFSNVRSHLLFLKSPPNFLANAFQRIKTHEHVKFWQNRSIGYKDVKIFQFFKVAVAAIVRSFQ